jgi:hypothetical protein
MGSSKVDSMISALVQIAPGPASAHTMWAFRGVSLVPLTIHFDAFLTVIDVKTFHFYTPIIYRTNFLPARTSVTPPLVI